MAHLELKVQSDDDAMSTPDGARAEFVRLLRAVAMKIDNGSTEGRLLDVNGNRVGAWVADVGEEGEDA